MPPSRRLGLVPLAIALSLVLGGAGARAESALRLAKLDPFGTILAATYDETTGRRLGGADISLTRRDDGHLLLVGYGAIDGEALIQVATELEPTPDGEALRPVWQESHSWRKGGVSQGRMWIDHRAGFAVCTPADDSDESPVRIDLPAQDRIANVPLNLLLEPLATGVEDRIEFQFLACRAARVVDANAQVAKRSVGAAGVAPGPVEVRSELDFGLLTPLARAFLPRFSFWFDPSRDGAWVAHRMPIFTGGPEVLVVRSGVPLGTLVTH